MGRAERRDARTFARSMLLSGGPSSKEAHSLIQAIVHDVIASYKASRGQCRPSMMPKYRKALEPFLADLFGAAAVGKWSKLATNTEALQRLPGGATAFKAMRLAMASEGLLEELPGYIRHYEMFGHLQTRSSRTCFRPTGSLLALARRHGVSLEDVGSHFTPGKAPPPAPSAVLEVRAAKLSKKDRPRLLPIDLENPQAAAIMASTQHLNAFLMEPGRIEGIAFAGLRRVFSNGDLPGFDWQWHGRFYSMPGADAYENMEGGTAARSAAIRIDGSKTTEVDFSASHLTVIQGLLGFPFDASIDPYDLPGITREEVKAWITMALGASNPNVGGRKFDKARAVGIDRYPFLADLQSLGVSTLDLQYHEAEIMLAAMEALRDQHDVAFLPVHDSLMVPKVHARLAAETMVRAFQAHFIDRIRLATAPNPRVNGY